jgi:hypothetical protein
MRISRPLAGTAVAGAALGATLAWGLTMASASTGQASQSGSAGAAAARSAVSTATPAPSHGSGHCPHMSGGNRAPHATPGSTR